MGQLVYLYDVVVYRKQDEPMYSFVQNMVKDSAKFLRTWKGYDWYCYSEAEQYIALEKVK